MTTGVRVWLQTDRAALYDSTVLALDSLTRGTLDSHFLPTSDWYEVTDMVQSVKTKRGKGDTELEPCGTGTATVVLLDTAGLFDPLYRDSVVWPGVQTGMRVWIAQATDMNLFEFEAGGFPPDPVDLFIGRVDDTSVDRDGPFAARVTLSLIDEMGVIAQSELSPQVRAAEPIDQRIGWVLGTLAYAGQYVADTAYNTAYALDLTTVQMKGNAAKHLNELARSEGYGMVFCDRSGRIRFRRRRPYVSTAISGLPVCTFQDDLIDDPADGSLGSTDAFDTMSSDIDCWGAYPDPFIPYYLLDAGSAFTDPAGAVNYTDNGAESLGKTVINTMTVTNRAGTTKTAQDALSVQLRGIIADETKQEAAWWTDTGGGAEADRQATWTVGRLADGGYGVTEVTVATGQLAEYQRRLIAGLELGDLVTVTSRPRYTPTARLYRLDAFVIGVEHKAGREGFGLSTTIRLAASTGATSWS